MRTNTYSDFEAQLAARHEHPLTNGLSTLGDVLWLASVPIGLVTRKTTVAVGVFLTGTVSATVAHLFQPGTLKDEIAAVFRHPVWAARAELQRVIRSLS